MIKVMIDFQEAVEELYSGFIHSAYAELSGHLWKMKVKGGSLKFYCKIEGVFYIQIPPPELYLIKWQPVRETVAR